MMPAWIFNILNKLRSSLWLIPSCMALLAIFLSLITPYLDEVFSPEIIDSFRWLSNMGPEGAMTLLSTIAGSMITIAGVVFSITIVALTLASNQFGPRLLGSFMRDRGNQFVLGTFVATFLYCLLVLRTIHLPSENGNTPYWGTFVGLVLAVCSLGVLIYFIHHIAVAIQAPHLIAAVYEELEEGMNNLFPERMGKEKEKENDTQILHQVRVKLETDSHEILAETSGYLQAVENNRLMEIARKHQLVLCLHYRPGHYIIMGNPLLKVLAEETVTPALAKSLNKQFICGIQRTQEQDIEFSILQLVEVAVRALSPGVNDPFTCIQCIDHLSAILCQLAQRQFPSPYRYDKDEILRIIAPAVTFQEIVDTAFHQIRQHGKGQMAVIVCLLKGLGRIAERVERENDAQAIHHHVEMIRIGSRNSLEEEHDRKEIETHCREVLAQLSQGKTPNILLKTI